MKHIIIIFLTLTSINILAQNNQDTTQETNNELNNDTTTLRLKIIKFNKYNSLDTILPDTTQRHSELFDKYSKSFIPVINLGQIATPSKSLLFIERKNFSDFIFLNHYVDFLSLPQNSFYVNTNRPYTNIEYMYGPKNREEQDLKLTHTQSIGDSLNIGINFNVMTSANLTSDKKNSAITKIRTWVFKEFKNYNIYASFYSNKIKRIENGGTIDTAAKFEHKNLSYYFDNNGQNIINYRGFFINQNFKTNNKFKITHNLKTIKLSKTFFEETPNKILGTPQITKEQTLDSIGLKSLDNSLIVSTIIKHATINVSFTNRLQKIFFFKGYIRNLNGEFMTKNFVSASVANLKFNKFKLNALSKFHLTSRNKGDIETNISLTYKINKQNNIKIKQTFEKQTPDFFLDNYNGNYQKWSNNFSDITTLTANIKYMNTKYNLEIGADYHQIKNYIYFDSTITPQQINTIISIKTAWIKKTFTFGPLVTDINIYGQMSNNNKITNIPKLITSGSIFFNFSLFKHAINLNIGTNVWYSTKFFKYSYSPSIGMFYLTNKNLSGNYPVINLFLSGKIKRATIIIRFDHANARFFSDFFSTTEHYHVPHYYTRIGVKWWFKN